MIYSYYSEIKNRFLLLVISWLSLSLISYIYKEIVLFLFIKPCIINNFNVSYFIYTNITGNYLVYLQVITFISNQVFLIYFLYHFFLFMSLGLYNSEYYRFKLILKLEIFFVLFVIFFINTILLPVTLNFFLSFQEYSLYFEAKICEYLDFYILLYNSCILSCQIFIFLILFLESTIKNGFNYIKNLRRFFYLFFVLFSTIVTPPDLISQVILSLVCILIYELLIIYYVFKYQI